MQVMTYTQMMDSDADVRTDSLIGIILDMAVELQMDMVGYPMMVMDVIYCLVTKLVLVPVMVPDLPSGIRPCIRGWLGPCCKL
jgi:hypothetical protein